MKLAVISDCTYRSSTPDYINNLSFYGSEPYHAVIAKGLLEAGNEIHWFAPTGSEPIGTFHPQECHNGGWTVSELLNETSLEGGENLTVEYLLNEEFDFILDFTANVQNIEQLSFFYGYRNYGCFRNGYAAYNVPRMRLADRHYIVPSHQNKRLFEARGFKDVAVIYYGIPDFYSRYDSFDEGNEYWSIIAPLPRKNYFLYPHRPTHEKGSLHILQLAKELPEEIFVFMVSNNPLIEHQTALLDLKKQAIGLKNIRFVELPLTNKHHYYKRELMRHAKAILSPFNPHIYKEGFGLANAEAVACGTPILISDSESSRELWIDEKDGLIIPYDDRAWGFKQSIKNFYSYNFEPKNKFTVDKCIENYTRYIQEMRNSNIDNPKG